MEWFGFDLGSMFWGLIVASVVAPVIITGLVIGVIVWAIRRSAPVAEDPAVAELRGRLARGEIDPIEFEVRMRSLRRDD